MRPTAIVVVVLLVAACAKQEKAPAADTAMAAPAAVAPAPPPPFSLAAAAGKWEYVAKSATGDTVLVKAELTATADTAGWTILLPGRKVLALKVSVGGDSVMTSVGPYESVLRKGVQVTTESMLRMVDSKLVGTSTAHYSTKSADSVRHLVIEATRKP